MGTQSCNCPQNENIETLYVFERVEALLRYLEPRRGKSILAHLFMHYLRFCFTYLGDSEHLDNCRRLVLDAVAKLEALLETYLHQFSRRFPISYKAITQRTSLRF